MKLKIKVRSLGTKREWEEDYDVLIVGNLQQAEEWADRLIKRFNETLRPGELRREVVSTSLVGVSTKHDWQKMTSGMSVSFRGGIVDIFQCSVCQVTGKRFGLRAGIKRDSKFRAKKYAICPRDRHISDDADREEQQRKDGVK